MAVNIFNLSILHFQKTTLYVFLLFLFLCVSYHLSLEFPDLLPHPQIHYFGLQLIKIMQLKYLHYVFQNGKGHYVKDQKSLKPLI